MVYAQLLRGCDLHRRVHLLILVVWMDVFDEDIVGCCVGYHGQHYFDMMVYICCVCCRAAAAAVQMQTTSYAELIVGELGVTSSQSS